jgi:pilus assembly protein Flp/PilA
MGRQAYSPASLWMSSFALHPSRKRSGELQNLTAGGQTSMDLFLVKTWLKARMNVDTERGATMVEYVLILALIAILVIGVVAALGHSVSSKFSQASSGIG